jgi:hypothetical protein
MYSDELCAHMGSMHSVHLRIFYTEMIKNYTYQFPYILQGAETLSCYNKILNMSGGELFVCGEYGSSLFDRGS